MSARAEYVLGSEAPEIARLDAQAASIEPASRLLLKAAGIRQGMRVLDLGTGLGHVARLVGELVGPEGGVVGLDRSPELLAVAADRARAAGSANVSFVEGDVRTWRDGEFDAVVGRLVLFHLPDAVDAVRHHLEALRPGGLFVALDFDCGACRTEPPVALAAQCLDWLLAAFRSADADPVIGTRLALLLAEAGVADVESFGVQGYLAPSDPRGPILLGGVIRSLAPQIVAAGIASEAELGLDTLEARIADALAASDAVMLPPTLVGAWGRRR